MFDAFLSPDQFPFLVAAGVLVGLVAVGALGMASGHAPALGHTIDLHAGADGLHGAEGLHGADVLKGIAHLAGHDGVGHGSSAFGLGWLNVGRVPFLVLLMIMLGAFAVAGFAMVLILQSFGLPAPWFATVPAATAVAVIVTRPTTGLIGRLFPRDETYVTTPDDWIGCTAEITLGPARAGLVAIGRLKDRYGNWHFPHVEPLKPGGEIPQGSIVLVVSQRDGVLQVIPAEGRLKEQS